MNDLHLKYQQHSGVNVTRDANNIESEINYPNLEGYIKWLEEQIDEKDELLNIAVDLIPDANEKDKIKLFGKHSKHYYDRKRNR